MPSETSPNPSRMNPVKRNHCTHLLAALLLAVPAMMTSAAEEQPLLAILQSNASAVAKCEACKQLRLVGTARSVPALGALLSEERVAQAARYALEGIPAPETVVALRQALGQTSGLLKAGIIDSLGWRRDEAAVPRLAPLLADPDATLATAAATALGRIGGPESLAALKNAKAKAPPTVRPAVLEALLNGAEQLLAAGQLGEAESIYRELAAATEGEATRVAAQAGLIRTGGGGSFDRFFVALDSLDKAAQLAALLESSRFPPANTAAVLNAVLGSAQPALQIALLARLQELGDPVARPLAVGLARGTNAAVRLAALKALSQLGAVGNVLLLARAATSRDPAEQAVAREALATLRGDGISNALVAELAAAPPAVQMELARALAARAETNAQSALLQMARSPEPAARRAALLALGSLSDASQLGGLVDLLVEAKTPELRAAVFGTFETIAERTSAGSPVDAIALLRGMDTADVETRVAVLQVSALFADEKLRAAFRAALGVPDKRLRDAAARALCRTRDAALLPDLLNLARQTDDASLRSLALERSVRLAADDGPSLSVAQRADALGTSAELASRPEDRRQVLSGLARVPQTTTLKRAAAWLADDAVRAEAELTCLQIAEQLGATEFAVIEPVLKQLAAAASQPAVRTNAEALLRRLDSGWLCAGPFRKEGKQAQELFDLPFPPEQNGSAEVRWQRAPGSADPTRAGEVDLGGVTGGDHCVLYLKTRVHVPAAQPVLLAIGSDDGLKLWVNGDLVHANNAVRGLTPGQDRAAARLREGWNDFFVKLTQHTVGCGLSLRLTREDGQAIPGLRLDPQGGTKP